MNQKYIDGSCVCTPSGSSLTIAYAILCLPGSSMERIVFDAGDRLEMDIWVEMRGSVTQKCGPGLVPVRGDK